MAKKIPDLSVIIATYNTRDLTLKCLESVFKEISGLEFEIFVVDNNSSDKTSEEIRKRFPAVKIIENEENLGFARACNQAIRVSEGKHVLLLNSDTVVLDEAPGKMINYLKNRPEVGALGPALLDKNSNIQKSCAKKMTLLSTFRESWLGKMAFDYDKAKSNEPSYVDILSGACLMVPQETIDKVGLLDENYFMYSEDVDWSYRIAEAGYKLVYFPSAKVIHLGSGSTGTDKERYNKVLLRNRVAVFKKYNNFITGFLGALILYSGFYLRKAFKKILGKS
ncbi:MAG: glycosyltransferase family 2 protein [Firmicutes bacterium]|nr:glycosyltransferase family 2 protein [Bacillota bacterium]